jgi:hypothetical protein
MAVTLKRTTFWGVTPCNLVEIYSNLGGMYCFQLEFQRVGQVKCCLLLACLLGLLFNSEDEGSTFFENGKMLLDYTASHLRRQYSSNVQQ